ncbi:DUF1833 domain-containing protein [Allopusillimonas soli]|uniref:DUF1833 family protein n=1 Tax=Allopusillimonas soli TaxID=659016 RepID=A0A853FLT8_9BURK|nr:DUF1833 family protein [Allopusillimonas soli]NYT38866.1 DUF1833 family protein [Allopusillimonas soli]TEA70135.1 DUF1833 domain-containing protein [Allopusillimonas soli]
MSYSKAGRRNLLATSADEPLLQLIEITHPDLAEPARFVNDNENIVVEGHTFFATAFTLIKPDDVDQQTPKAQLSVDNVGRELTQWLEYSNGGKGARCRILAVLRSSNEEYATDYFAQDYTLASNPDIEFDMTLDLSGIHINNAQVSSDLGFQNTLMQPAVTMRFDPLTTPGAY